MGDNTNATLDASSSLVKGTSAAVAGYTQSKAFQIQGDYQKQTAELNAKLAEFQADDAIARGEKAATQVKKQGKKLVGSQRAALASQGIAIDSGSALAIQQDTAMAAAQDAITIKNNAWREAWGFKTEALTQRSAGTFAQNYANFNANNTLLTGGLTAAGEFLQGGYKLSRNGKAKA